MEILSQLWKSFCLVCKSFYALADLSATTSVKVNASFDAAAECGDSVDFRKRERTAEQNNK